MIMNWKNVTGFSSKQNTAQGLSALRIHGSQGEVAMDRMEGKRMKSVCLCEGHFSSKTKSYFDLRQCTKSGSWCQDTSDNRQAHRGVCFARKMIGAQKASRSLKWKHSTMHNLNPLMWTHWVAATGLPEWLCFLPQFGQPLPQAQWPY